ncbi:MAG TPA: hypothetical protein VG935_02450 [Patescibacteria group bacterium]|nr:hypothetical protein [Patescibacteria group bacterium]
MCQAFWLEGDVVSSQSAHFLPSFASGQDKEYTLEEAEDKDQEHRSVFYPTLK